MSSPYFSFLDERKVTATADRKRKSRIPNRSGEPPRSAQTVGIRGTSITEKRSKK